MLDRIGYLAILAFQLNRYWSIFNVQFIILSLQFFHQQGRREYLQQQL